MKHTQGPWSVVPLPESTAIFISSAVHGAICQIEADSKHKEEHKANAQLIATAPELLQTCIDIRIKLMNQFGLFGGGNKLNEVFDILNKVIEKANGEKEVVA